VKSAFSKWIAVLAVLLMPLSAASEEKPLWEAGIGVGALSFPDYRGSAHQGVWMLPTPYLVYRGKFLKSDRNGVRGTLFDSDRIELNMSFSASLPVKSRHSGPRRGMPDLQPTVEFGPSLLVNLWRSGETKARRLDLRLPVRAAYTVRGGVRYAGLVFSPALNYNSPLFNSGWNFGVMAGPIFANARQHKYFYEVEPRYAQPGRPAYRASGGYSGSQFITSLSKRFNNFWVGGFVRYDTLHGAAFDDSPLVERKYAWFGGLGVTWIFGKSSEMVTIREDD
jgi:outer membrane scaffolding protein for murein synthesis (MipA/OmpV family)